MSEYNFLFSIDDSYLEQLKTTLLSIKTASKEGETIHAYVMVKKTLHKMTELSVFCQKQGILYHPILVNPHDFKEAPVSERYPDTIYYRLLAHEYLPEDLQTILYLDADILCLNNWKSVFEFDLGNNLYGACSHAKLTNLTNVINKVRLKSYESEGYFNSGVLLMNLPMIRKKVKRADIYQFISENTFNLLLPDQDVLNALYGDRIVSLPDEKYNYDVRKKTTYELISKGKWTLDWVIGETVFLHFCGKEKPWDPNYTGRFASLYKYFANQARKVE